MKQRHISNRHLYSFRPYQTKDEPALLSLWKEVFKKDIPSALWKWKYADNPYGQNIMLALSETGTILVLYGGIPYHANWNGVTVKITQLMDIMTKPAYRGLGLFVKTGNKLFDVFAGDGKSLFYYGFPGKYHFDLGAKYLKYKRMGDVNFLKADISFLENRKPAKAQIHQVRSVDPSFDVLWDEMKGAYPFSIIRNSDFLKWRFLEHPEKEYEIWTFVPDRDAKKGYAVLSVQETTASIVDILMPPSNEMVESLLCRIGSKYKEKGVQSLQTWLPSHHFLKNAFIFSGFRECKDPLGIVPTGRTFFSSLSFDWVSENIFYTMADADLF